MIRPRTLAAALLLAATAPAAHAQVIRGYTIPAGDLSRALREFAKQSDWQVLYTTSLVVGARTDGYAGAGRANEVLARLLATTDLTYRVGNVDTLLIVRKPRQSDGQRGRGQLVGVDETEFTPPVPEVAVVQEVVITASRRSEPLSRAPMSVSALTMSRLDQSGLRTFSDITSTLPSLLLTQTSPGVGNVAIRGIVNAASANTAPTTGFYLDDTPLQKRNTSGFQNANGTPLPVLFDLDRVEILRGPQGTLYGASSQGGTVRYITTQPSLTQYSSYARLDVSTMEDGGRGYETGFAIGGPLALDQLGFRASYFQRRQPGYIDIVDVFTGTERVANANVGDTQMFRGSLLWAPSSSVRLQLSYLQSLEKTRHNGAAFTAPPSGPIEEREACFDASDVSAERPNPYPEPISCGSPNVTFRRPAGGTIGPFPDVGRYDFLTTSDPSPAKTALSVTSLSGEVNLERFSLKSITSFIGDANFTDTGSGVNEFNLRYGDYVYADAPASVSFPEGGRFNRGLGFSGLLPEAGQASDPWIGRSLTRNKRHGVVQEVRATSTGDGPLSWVTGVFYSRMRGTSEWRSLQNQDLFSSVMYGLTTEQRYGIGAAIDRVTGLPILYEEHDYQTRDVELAAYGEGNYWIGPKLRLTAGVRVSWLDFQFRQHTWGTAAGFFAEDPRGVSSSGRNETPVNPKVAALYELGEDKILFATVAKGYRSGGVNPRLAAKLCDVVLSRFGLTSDQVPVTYDSDTVWSYELGSKSRLLGGRLQLNGDVYRIDWSDVQTPVNFNGCGTPYIQNAGKLRSQGVELEIEARPVPALTVQFAGNYLDASYRQTIAAPAAPGFPPSLIAVRGQRLPLPPWSFSLGALYERSIGPQTRAYVRADWRWSSEYDLSPPFGVVGYSPDMAIGAAVSRVNARVGVRRGRLDVNIFAYNLLASKHGTLGGGRSGCTPVGGADCTTFAQFTPFRTTSLPAPPQVGLQLTYRQ